MSDEQEPQAEMTLADKALRAAAALAPPMDLALGVLP